MGRNRGRKSRLKKAVTHLPPTQEEMDALQEKLDHEEPIISAIVSVAVLDLELADMIRKRLRRKDDITWGSLNNETGPLQSFSQKIDMAFAMGCYDDSTRKNLHVIRRVRNVFAHPKRMVTFSDPLIVALLRGIELKAGKFKKNYRSVKTTQPAWARDSFISLCLIILIEFAKKRKRDAEAQTRRYKARYSRRMGTILSLLPGQTTPRGVAGFAPLPHSGDPKAPASRGLLSGLSHLFEASPKQQKE